jgi:hypothetical protein
VVIRLQSCGRAVSRNEYFSCKIRTGHYDFVCHLTYVRAVGFHPTAYRSCSSTEERKVVDCTYSTVWWIINNKLYSSSRLLLDTVGADRKLLYAVYCKLGKRK